MKIRQSLVLAATVAAFTLPCFAADVEAAKELAEQNNCMQCHGVKKEKDGPSFMKTAEKYRGKTNAEDEIVKHLNSGREIKLADGTKEKHKIIKTIPPNDAAQVKNLVQYILSVQP